MPQDNDHNLNCFRVIESSVPNGYLGVKPCIALQPDGKWHALGYYSHNMTKASDIHIDFDGTPIKLLSYEQYERYIDGAPGWAQVADDHGVTVDKTGIDLGSLAQDSRYPNAIFGPSITNEPATLWVEASDDSNNEIFVRYINDENNLNSMKFAQAYPPTERELDLFSAWLESPVFSFDHDLKLLTDYDGGRNVKNMHTKAVKDDPQQLIQMGLMHTKLRTLVQDTTLRLYLEVKYEDREDILEKLRSVDQNGIWKPYYDHDRACVARIKDVPGYKSLILNKQWDKLRKLVLKINFPYHQLLNNRISHNRYYSLEQLSVFDRQTINNQHKIKLARDIDSLSQDKDFFKCSYSENNTVILLNMLCTRIIFVDPAYANNATTMHKVIQYLKETERDISVSLRNRHASDAYSPALIDLLITRVDALASSALGMENKERLQAIKDGFNNSKAFMQSNNHQAHPMSQKFTNSLAYYCCQDVPYKEKREAILRHQIGYEVVSKAELLKRLYETMLEEDYTVPTL